MFLSIIFKVRMKKDNKTSFRQEKGHQPQWFEFDAAGKTLGRLAAEISKVLRGKHRPDFTPFADCGDGVIVLNAEKVRVTGNKERTKVYRYYTGAIGGLREVTYEKMMAKNPRYAIEKAVSGMMPKTRRGKQQLRKLRIFVGDKHKHEAQKPVKVG